MICHLLYSRCDRWILISLAPSAVRCRTSSSIWHPYFRNFHFTIRIDVLGIMSASSWPFGPLALWPCIGVQQFLFRSNSGKACSESPKGAWEYGKVPHYNKDEKHNQPHAKPTHHGGKLRCPLLFSLEKSSIV